MKLGFGLYKHLLNHENYDFAVQCGATDLVVHWVDYFNQGSQTTTDQPIGGLNGFGVAGDPNKIWTVAELLTVKKQINAAGLNWYAIENFDPAHWSDILLDGDKRELQIKQIKQIIQNVGEAGIPVIGYNFSIASVAGRETSNKLRGNASGVAMNGINENNTTPIPQGMVWNMWVDKPNGKNLPAITSDELWRRLENFLNDVLPTAEKYGVTLALHPDDPPLDFVRGQPRLVNRESLYTRLLAINNSQSNGIELCLGTVQEMPESSAVSAAQKFAKNSPYIHLRNVRGKVPHYLECFIDEGDININAVLHELKKQDYQGVIIPDHAPQMTCGAPWHAGMAFAMGYLKALINLHN